MEAQRSSRSNREGTGNSKTKNTDSNVDKYIVK